MSFSLVLGGVVVRLLIAIPIGIVSAPSSRRSTPG